MCVLHRISGHFSERLYLAHGVTFVKYASILLQSLIIMIDEDFVMEIIDLTKIKGAWESLDEECVLQYKTFNFIKDHAAF